jgi:ribosomal protein S1
MFANSWDKAIRHYLPGTVVRGIMQKILPFGAFFKASTPSTSREFEGLVNINNFS